ncbi:hypothetical protein AMATHDRAFT_65501 [Amanita thiersii Skay4041]|uniref:Phosphoinositide phospholipase C n=1 Tax=Amanita thiersii Skay4041 TaxID=703135 RepID=A0A2A9NL39_9AGAR|nr:hypothetical protein AMATHDRAFT_65501 [Amanita thiersii Skay4041]
MALADPKAWIRRKASRLAQMAGYHKDLDARLTSHTGLGLKIAVDTGGSSSSSNGNSSWDLSVPEELVKGTIMTKVSEKRQKEKQVVVLIDPDEGKVIYPSRRGGIVPLESIKELRTGTSASYYRAQLGLPASYDTRWLTIIYILNGEYKTLHLIAATPREFELWDTTLRRLHAVRQGLMRGLGNDAVRETVWERMYWKAADGPSGDQRLDLKEVEKLCLRLGVSVGREELGRMFVQADTQKRGYLGFEEFRQFVKILKRRPEVEELHKVLCASNGGVFDFKVFQRFMRESQQCKLSDDDLKLMFAHYIAPSTTSPTSRDATGASHPVSSVPSMSVFQFQRFLLSEDNSVFSELHKPIWQDMTRPLSEYYISSSHNTYLVGHQLVGVSTIEGYIRALLHSCRTVEMDIYDGPSGEPVVYHGKTLTSKVALRDICQAIAKYAFATSPYPVMISAEVHCGVKQQDKMVEMMTKIFGDTLVRAPVLPAKIEKLPSPEDLKGKILLKAKNLFVVEEIEEALRAWRNAEAPVVEASLLTSSESDSDTSSSDSSEDEEGVDGEGARGEDEEGVIGGIKSKWRRMRGKRKSVPSSSRGSVPPVEAAKSGSGIGGVPGTPGTSLGSATASQVQQQLSSLAVTGSASPRASPAPKRRKMSDSLASLLVYTVGVKCHGLGQGVHVQYAPEHIFSLSESAVNRMIKAKESEGEPGPSSGSGSVPVMKDEAGLVVVETTHGGEVVVPSPSPEAGGGVRSGMWELIKHNQTHLTRIYPKGMRVNSSNYQPHRYWAAGAQVVAINWQTFDLGYVMNQTMFARNGRSGYVLKPEALRRPDNAEMLAVRTRHFLNIKIISAQQLPRPKDSRGQDIVDKTILDPYVEVSVHIPDWTRSPFLPHRSGTSGSGAGIVGAATTTTTTTTAKYTPARERERAGTTPEGGESSTREGVGSAARTVSARTRVVKNNGFNPVWNEGICIPFDCVGSGGMRELIFVEVRVMQQGEGAGDEPLGAYCVPLGCMEQGFRHLPLYDSQLSQHLFSTLFVEIGITDV